MNLINEQMEKILEFLNGRNPLTLNYMEMTDLVEFVCEGVSAPQRLSFASDLAESMSKIEDTYPKLVAAKFVQAICLIEAASINVVFKQVREVHPELFGPIVENDR